MFETFVISKVAFPTKRWFKLKQFFFLVLWIHILSMDIYFIYTASEDKD